MSHYETALGICERYLKGDARRFLDRQIKAHLEKEPGDLDGSDRETLAQWCRISGKLIIGEDRASALERDLLAA